MPPFGSFMSMNFLSSMILPKAIDRNETTKAIHLIQSGASPNAPADSQFPLFLRGTVFENHEAFRRVRPVLCMAIERGNVDVVKKLLEFGADVSTKLGGAGGGGWGWGWNEKPRGGAKAAGSMERHTINTSAGAGAGATPTTPRRQAPSGITPKPFPSRLLFLPSVPSLSIPTEPGKSFTILLLTLFQFKLHYLHRILPSPIAFFLLMLPVEAYLWRGLKGMGTETGIKANYLNVEKYIFVSACLMFGVTALLFNSPFHPSSQSSATPQLDPSLPLLLLSNLTTLLSSLTIRGYLCRRILLLLFVVWESAVRVVKSVKEPGAGMLAVVELIKYDSQFAVAAPSSPSSSPSISSPSSALPLHPPQESVCQTAPLALLILPHIPLSDAEDPHGLAHALLTWSVLRGHTPIVRHLLERGVGEGLAGMAYTPLAEGWTGRWGSWGYFDTVVGKGLGEVLAVMEMLGERTASVEDVLKLTPLALAARGRHTEILGLLLEHCQRRTTS